MPAETTPRMAPPSIASAMRAPSPCGARLPRAGARADLRTVHATRELGVGTSNLATPESDSLR